MAIISDIHGNSSALRAVLNKIDLDIEIEHIYCLGDLIGIGHETNEVLELLFSKRDISFVKGNHDEAVLKIIEGMESDSKGEEREHHEWIASRLEKRFISDLQRIPMKLNAEINGKHFLFLHYHLSKENQFLPIDSQPCSSKLDDLYASSNIDVVCFGHHHMIHHFKSKERLYLNPSSLGCNHKPVAEYATVCIGNSGEIEVSFIEVPYDPTEFISSFKKLNVPAADSILQIFYGK